MICTPKRWEAAGDKCECAFPSRMISPFVGIVNAGENLDQGALAAPVLPGKTMDFAGTNREADVGQRAHSAEALADAAHLDEVGCALPSSRLRLLAAEVMSARRPTSAAQLEVESRAPARRVRRPCSCRSPAP